MIDDVLALVYSVWPLELSRSGRHILALMLCAGLVAPFCAVFAVDARSQHDCTFQEKAHKGKSLEIESFSSKGNEQTEMARGQVNEVGVVHEGSPSGQRGANRARRGRETRIGKSIPTPHTFLNSFGWAAKFKCWPIRHWGGEDNFTS